MLPISVLSVLVSYPNKLTIIGNNTTKFNGQAKVFVDDTTKVVGNTAKITSEFASKVAEEGVVVPDLFKLDDLMEEQEKEKQDISDLDSDSDSDSDDEHFGKTGNGMKCAQVTMQGNEHNVEEARVVSAEEHMQNDWKQASSFFTDTEMILDSSAQSSICRENLSRSANDEVPSSFCTPQTKSTGTVKKLTAEAETPWDWDTPAPDVMRTTNKYDDCKDRTEFEFVEENHDFYESLAMENFKDDGAIGDIDEEAVESSINRQESEFLASENICSAEDPVHELKRESKKKRKERKRMEKEKRKKEKRKGKLDFFGFGSTEDENAQSSSGVVNSLVGLALIGETSGILDDNSDSNVGKGDLGDLFGASKVPELSSLEKMGLAFASQLPQRLTISDSKHKGPSFFDGADDEDDPILLQVEINKTNPNSSNWFKPRVAPLPDLPKKKVYLSPGHNAENSILRDVESQEHTSKAAIATSSDGGWKKKILNMIVFLMAVIQVSCAVIMPWIKSFCLVLADMVINRSCNKGKYQSSYDIEAMEPEECRKYRIRMLLINLWDFVSSATGLSVLTALFLFWSYWKFRRYGTDAGER